MIKITLQSAKVLVAEETGKEKTFITSRLKIMAVGNKISLEAKVGTTVFNRFVMFNEIEFADGVKSTVQETVEALATLVAGFPEAV